MSNWTDSMTSFTKWPDRSGPAPAPDDSAFPRGFRAALRALFGRW